MTNESSKFKNIFTIYKKIIKKILSNIFLISIFIKFKAKKIKTLLNMELLLMAGKFFQKI